jgi:predicted  nucleic acid-binding Zn-ribbon protein
VSAPASEAAAVLQLHDLDLMAGELRNPKLKARLKKLGYEFGEITPLERLRPKLLAQIDRRWINHYERALKRYGRAVAVVRDRVCLGCFITLPTSASPNADESLTLCESCGRILYWR